MAVAFRAVVANSTTSATTLTVTIPATIVAGDFMVAFVAYASRLIPTPPSGWTQLRYDQGVGVNKTDAYVFYRWAQAGDAGSAFTVTPATSGRGCISLLGYSGVDLTTPINVHGVQKSTADSHGPITAPSVTTTVADCVVIEGFAAVNTNGSTTTIASIPATTRSNQAVASNFIGQATAEQQQAVAGASGATTAAPPAVQDFSTVGHTIALGPALPAGGKVKTAAGVTKPTKIFPGGTEKPVKFKDGGGTWQLA